MGLFEFSLWLFSLKFSQNKRIIFSFQNSDFLLKIGFSFNFNVRILEKKMEDRS